MWAQMCAEGMARSVTWSQLEVQIGGNKVIAGVGSDSKGHGSATGAKEV